MVRVRRQDEILRAIRARGACTIAELAAEHSVSDETIRRNLKPLVGRGLVERVHGGVVASEQLDEPPFQRRMQQNTEAKKVVAELIVAMVEDGDTIMMDSGSTTAFVARALSIRKNLSVVTNNTEIARILAQQPGNRVHLAGGELRADDWAAFGASTIDFIRQFQARYAILSIGAVTENGDFMDFHLQEAEFSRALIEQAQVAIVVADHSKFGKRAFVNICERSQIDHLVSDQLPPESICQRLKEAGVELVVPKTQ